MSSKKYRRDYRLIEHVDERGRVKAESVYCGEHYLFSAGTEKAKASLKVILTWAVISMISFLISLLPYSTASRTMFVMLPYLFSALPLWMLISSVVRLLKKEDLEQKDADFANNRIPACCLWLMILPGLSMIGEICTILLKHERFLQGDLVFLVCAALLFTGASVCFSRRKDIAAEK